MGIKWDFASAELYSGRFSKLFNSNRVITFNVNYIRQLTTSISVNYRPPIGFNWLITLSGNYLNLIFRVNLRYVPPKLPHRFIVI